MQKVKDSAFMKSIGEFTKKSVQAMKETAQKSGSKMKKEFAKAHQSIMKGKKEVPTTKHQCNSSGTLKGDQQMIQTVIITSTDSV